MKEMKIKKALAVCIILALTFCLPGQSYQALAAQIDEGRMVETIPSISIGIGIDLPGSQQTIEGVTNGNNLREMGFSIPSEAIQQGELPADLKLSKREGALAIGKSHETSAKTLDLSGPATRGRTKKLGRIGVGARVLSKIAGIRSRLGLSPAALTGQSSGELNKIYDGAVTVTTNVTPLIRKPESSATLGSVQPAGAGSHFFRSGIMKAGIISAVVGAGAVSAVPAYAQAIHGISVGHAGFLAILAGLGTLVAQGAYWLSQGLNFAMSPPEFYRLVKNGKYDWRTYMMIAVNLAVGFFVAPAQSSADKFLWGSESIFMALIWGTGMLIAKLSHKNGVESKKSLENHPQISGSMFKRWIDQLRHDTAMQITLALTPLLIAAGFGLYFSVATFVPTWIASISTIKLSLSKISIVIQAVAQGFFISLYIPDLVAIHDGEPLEESLSQGFTLLFCLSATCFVVWGGSRAWSNPAKHIDLIILTVSNVFQFLFSLITYRALHRQNAGSNIKPSDSSRLTQVGQGVFKERVFTHRVFDYAYA
jgi:hypothetical protein